MVKIRLSLAGNKNNPSYKIVITEAREKRESSFIEYIGTYSPLTKDLVLNDERAKYWLSVGAQPTDRVRSFLVKKEILAAPTRKSNFTKKPKKKSQDRAKKAA